MKTNSFSNNKLTPGVLGSLFDIKVVSSELLPEGTIMLIDEKALDFNYNPLPLTLEPRLLEPEYGCDFGAKDSFTVNVTMSFPDFSVIKTEIVDSEECRILARNW